MQGYIHTSAVGNPNTNVLLTRDENSSAPEKHRQHVLYCSYTELCLLISLLQHTVSTAMWDIVWGLTVLIHARVWILCVFIFYGTVWKYHLYYTQGNTNKPQCFHRPQLLWVWEWWTVGGNVTVLQWGWTQATCDKISCLCCVVTSSFRQSEWQTRLQ